MTVESVPITGRESKSGLTEPLRALSEFYQALNTRDLDLMARHWAQTEEAVMANPVGGIQRGWDAIRAVYERIFSRAEPYWFELYDYSLHKAGEIFYVVGCERGEYPVGDTVLPMAIRTSRVFRRIEGDWRQVHHHGSIDDPTLLAAYQQAVNAMGSGRRT